MRRLRVRRGSALILVLLMTLAVAALAIAAIFMTSSAGLLSRFYDRERLFRYSAESALQITRSRLEAEDGIAVPDTGVSVLLSGWQPRDADGALIPGVSVNVYAAATGDTTGREVPAVTLLAQAYDASGTRHVRRMDLRRESFSRYQFLVDSFPSGVTFGPGTVAGRVHSNGDWTNTGSGNAFLDTVSVVGSIGGAATFDIDSVVGAYPITYPSDSTFARLDSLALAAGLRITPATGLGRGSRLEFLAIDADADGAIEPEEGFFKVFSLGAGYDTTRIRGNPALGYYFFVGAFAHAWSDDIVQNQCGAFYRIGGRWQFFPIAVHRSPWVRPLLVNSSTFPDISNGTMNGFDDYDYEAARDIVEQPTGRCFPAGSPYLMLTERYTNASGVTTATDADTVPFGTLAFSGGSGRGGEDTTFTRFVRTCRFATGTTGRCQAGTNALMGYWEAGTNPVAVSSAVRQAGELQFLFALSPPYNAASRGVVSTTTGPLYVSGTVVGDVTLRVNGSVGIIDDLVYAKAPGTPEATCETQLGVVAVGDITVVEGLMTRTRRIARSAFSSTTFTQHFGGVTGTRIHGALMSLTGTVGVESPGATMGASGEQPECPEESGSSNRANGGCFEHVGGAAMRVFTPHYSGSNTGFRYHGAPDRCQATNRRPPFFPLTNRYQHIRTLEIEASRANTPPEIRALLLRLKGKAL